MTQKSAGYWSSNATVKAHRRTGPNTYEEMERAQCRAEEWVGDAPDFREQVKEIMEMLCARPRENEYSGHERRVV